jgi:Holliday junction resolvasome RuvABC endonuclease subunit
MLSHPIPRVLAIDPDRRGFGFVLIEGTNRLIDWGVKASTRPSGALRSFAQLIARYEPDVIVLEDVRPETRRSRWTRRFLATVRLRARRRRLVVRSFTRKQVQRAFCETKAKNKHEIATVIADWFPILHLRLPPKRRTWMCEARSMAIFDAASLALTYFHARYKHRDPRP